jgi:hypothetical protein
MNRTARAVVLALGFCDAAAAQRSTASVDVGAMAMRYGDTISSAGVALSPALRISNGRSSLDAAGTVSKFGTGASVQGVLSGSAFAPTVRSFAGELTGTIGGSSHQDGLSTGQGQLGIRGHFTRDRFGAWVGGGAGVVWDAGTARNIKHAEVGAWMSLSSGVGLVLNLTPTTVNDSIRYVDNQASLHLPFTRAALDVTAGLRAGSRVPATPGQARAWGGVTLTAPVKPRVDFVFGAGTYPLDFTQGYPAGKYISAGLRLSREVTREQIDGIDRAGSAAITSFSVRRRSASQVAIELRAPNATTVEITGDFTQWEPRAMTAAGGGRFSIVLPITSGTYQMNMRLDGGPWTVPPGVTVIKDELGAQVAILSVPDR